MATAAPLKVSKSIEKNLVQAQETAKSTVEGAQTILTSTYEKASAAALKAKTKTVEVVSDRTFQVTAASATGGAVACGMGGATVGLFGGGFIGGLVGLIPALLTFGLSIPAGAAVGGGCGAAVGAAAGGTAGVVGGGATGYGVYTRREKIAEGANLAYAKVLAVIASAKEKGAALKADTFKIANAKLVAVKAKLADAKAQAKTYLGMAQEKTVQTATEVKAKTVEIASNKTVQVTAASAAGGAVACGTAGGVTGLAAGGTIGAAIGVVPALFTFGLSIPIGAAIGGGCGLVAGTAVGGSTGLVGGGVVGYGAFTKREEIKSGIAAARTKVNDAAGYVKDKAHTSADFVRTRIGGTGGTETMD